MVFAWSHGPQAPSGPRGNTSSICSGLTGEGGEAECNAAEIEEHY